MQPRSLQDIAIGNRRIGQDQPVLIIAEIGTAHGADLDTGYRLIDAAAKAGADCAKFQAVFAEEIIHPNTGNVHLPGGATPLFEVFRRLERDADFYGRLKAHTEAAGLLFMCSPFGLKSARLLREIGVEGVKIASPEINHYPLLDEVAGWGVPIILSAGVSTLGDIERAISRLPGEVAILHCVTAYPAPETDYNLGCVSSLSSIFDRHVGVSDHSLDCCLVPSLAVAVGAPVVEKHFTLNKDGGGLDDPVALTPAQFNKMTGTVRSLENLDRNDRLHHLMKRYGENTILGVLGNGAKRLADSERENYLTTNRSIFTVRDIPSGSVIATDDVALLRSEKNLHPGLSPDFLPVIMGRRAKKDLMSGHGIQWDDLLD